MATSIMVMNNINWVWGLFSLSFILFGESQQVPTPPQGFVQTANTQFVLNGSTFVFNGFNSYWMMNVVAVDPTQRFKVSDVFSQASTAGLTVCRTWAFNDGSGQFVLQKSPGVYNENTFQALDFVISEARRYNVKLILTLVNNYHDYGGRPQYVQWAKSAGVQVTSDDDFYTNPVIKGYYKNHVKRVLTRVNSITKVAYKEDPTIMSWELINEPRCNTTTGETLNGWIQEMAPYVKSIDNKHLLAIGMEGFYGYQIPDRLQYNPFNFTFGSDFISNNLIKEIDYTTIHAYPDGWFAGQSDKTQVDFMQKWLTIHWNDSRTILSKPLIFGEFGHTIKGNGTMSIQGRDSFLRDVYFYIYNLASRGGTIGGGLVWQIMDENMEGYYDGYEIVLPQSPSTTQLIHQQSTKMNALKQPAK